MLRPLLDSEYIFGIHEPGGEQVMLDAGKPGWVLFTEGIGNNPDDKASKDFTSWSNRGLGVMVRLNNGYEPDGTIPLSMQYENFAQRCANYVAGSRGCHIWIIGNEMNFAVERPARTSGRSVRKSKAAAEGDPDAPPPSPRERADRFNVLHPDAPAPRSTRSIADREVITPQLYARCYRLCREAIHNVRGHDKDQVLVGAPAPWNNQTQYEGNTSGDWVQYFQDILKLLGPSNCDGFTLHAYTHGDDPNLVHSTATMDAPFNRHHYHFFTYRDFMQAVPASMRHLPVYITETDQDVAWRNENRGWVQRAYAEIDWWNKQPGNQQIRALILYRWPKLDKWYIEGKQGVIDDFRQALKNDYQWGKTVPEPKPAYRVAFVSGGDIRQATTGQVLTTTLKLRNDGSKTWLKGGANPVRVGFHWDSGAGRPLVVPADKDFRTPLPKDVQPGETVTVENVQVAVPDEPGALRLRWDLVEEGVTWFKDQGSTEKVVTVTVKAGAPPTEIIVPETGKRVNGAFLDWYRRYGLDIAGYPYTDQFVDPATNLPTQVFQRVILEEFQPGSIRLRLAGQDLVVALDRLQAAVLEVDRLTAEQVELQSRISELEQELRRVIEGGGQAPVMRIPAPELIDIVEQLPRDAAGFVQRDLDAIRYLVINHTGGAPDLAIEKIAEYHRQRGYPGIAYHYFVDGNGVLFEVNPATDTVSDQGYLGEGLNIAIAGKFNDVVPTDMQLETVALLCAWLLQELNLSADAIKGVSEFVSTASPGWQWQHGKSYKNRLLEMVAAVAPEPAPDVPTTPGDSAEVDRLQAEIARLQAEVARAQAENGRLQAEITPLQAEIVTLRAQLAPLQQQLAEKTAQVAQLQAKVTALQKDVQTREQRISQLTTQIGQLTKQVAAQQAEIGRLNEALRQHTPGGVIGVPEPVIHDIVDKLPKHSKLRYSTRKLDKITHICVHHSATPANIAIERVAEYHVNPDPSRNKDAWPGIGYHFYIKPDGSIYQTNRLETISYHVYANNDYAVGICVSGDFTRAAPTPEQLKATAHLVAWLMQELKVAQDKVLGHKEFPNNDTSCPGVQWLEGHKWKNALMDAVRTLRSGSAPGVWPKTINHYMLFWQRPTLWAQEDWQAAENYIGRFRPTAGFSIDDARYAEFVTIVGGVAGVPYEVEQMLTAAGCKVGRLAGADFVDTKRILDELAERGQRFQHLTD